MKLKLNNAIMTELVKSKGITNQLVVKDYKDWRSEQEVDTDFLVREEVDAIYTAVTTGEARLADVDCRRTARQIRSLRKLDDDKAIITNLPTLAEAIKKKLATVEKHWLYIEDKDDDFPLPYFVDGIAYVPASERSGPAHINISLAYIERGDQKSKQISLRRYHIKGEGCSLQQVFDTAGFRLNDAEYEAQYALDYERWTKVHLAIGEQFWAHGQYKAQNGQDRWSHISVLLGTAENPGRAICDDDVEFKDESELISCSLWTDKRKIKIEDADDDSDLRNIAAANAGQYQLPVHFFVRLFDLKHHQFGEIYIRNITDYVYNEKMADELVLSDDRRQLIELLLGSGEKFIDIVKGKSQGVIVCLAGPPGVGKTLTAEVYAERTKRPLYTVQCSQLGINAEELEKELSMVLARAAKWHAHLLIDEADVYIRERGSDINQNAIVGVFLRLLEYFSGVLFMTTNREDVVDDAILSRLSALVRYELPTKEELLKLWDLFFWKNKIELSNPTLDDLVREFPTLSGRSINKLVSLAKSMSVRSSKPVTVGMIKYLSRFQAIERKS